MSSAIWQHLGTEYRVLNLTTFLSDEDEMCIAVEILIGRSRFETGQLDM